MAQQSSEAIRIPTQSEWEDLLPRLLLYTKRRLNRLSWDKTALALEPAELAQDIVMESIEQAISGQRVWPKEVSLYDFLSRVIDSKVLHTYERLHRQKKLEENIEKAKAMNPAEVYETSIFLKELMKQLEDDPIALKILELIYNEESPLGRRTIAERLQVSRYEVERAMSRIRYKVNSSKFASTLSL